MELKTFENTVNLFDAFWMVFSDYSWPDYQEPFPYTPRSRNEVMTPDEHRYDTHLNATLWGNLDAFL